MGKLMKKFIGFCVCTCECVNTCGFCGCIFVQNLYCHDCFGGDSREVTRLRLGDNIACEDGRKVPAIHNLQLS